MRKDYDFPEFILVKWQKLVDLFSSTFNLPATLIMQVDEDSMKIFAKCSTKENPYSLGESEKMDGLYCETVIKTKEKLLVSNALSDKNWDKNPDLKLGMIAYLGYPIKYPSGEIFGTICVLDNKENSFSKTIEDFLLQVKEIIELDIFTYHSYEKASNEMEQCMLHQFEDIGLNNKTQSKDEGHIETCIPLNNSLNQFKKKLSDQENKYKNLFSSSSSALAVLKPVFNSEGDVNDAEYIDMNANNEEIIGYKKNALVGKTIREIFPQTETYWFENFDTVVKGRESLQFESYYESLNKYLLINVFPLDDKTFAISSHDVSEQEVLKKKLDESERVYKTIFHESSSIMLLIDPENGTIIDANSTAIKFYGFPKKKFLTMNMHDINIMSTEDVQRGIDLVVAQKKTYFLFKHRLASGEIRDVEVYSGVIEINGQTMLHSVIHDVTKSREAMEKVSRLSMAVEQSPVAIVITDLEGDMLYCNPKHCEITGYSNKELIGHNSRLLKSGKFSRDDYVDLWKTIISGNKWEGEFFNKKKDGSFYWELAFIAPIKNDEGEIVNFIKIGEDISERKHLENRLNHSILKAEESDKLKSSFLANLSHEIRTPLNGIMGFTNLMLMDGISDEERKEYGSYVESSGNQLMSTMDNILKLSMIELDEMNVKYSKFDVNGLISEVKTYFSSEIHEKGLEFIVDCSCKGLVNNDVERIRQVLENLIGNAIKFTKKGKIAIKVDCNNSNTLLLSVEDTGIGIAAEDHNRVFDRFMQVDNLSTREFDGSGLGLAISKEIVILLGGEIWVESEIGKGSKFTFTIPSVPEDIN